MKKLTTLLFAFFAVHAWTQVDAWKKQLGNTTVDTTRARLMYQVGWELKYFDPEASGLYADSAYQIAIKNALTKLQIKCLQLKSKLEGVHGNFEKSLSLGEQALNLSMTHGYTELVTGCLNELGNTWSNINDFENARRYYDYAIRLAERTGNCSMLMKSLSNKALLFDEQGIFDDALQHYYKALQIGLNCGNDQEAIANIKANLGFLYAKLGKFDQAIQLNNEAHEIYQKLNNKSGIAKVISCTASINFMKGNLPNALIGYQTSLKMYEDLHDVEGMMADVNNISGVLATMGKFDESLIWMKKAISMGKQYGGAKTIASAYVNLSDIYFMMGDLSKALAYGDSGKYMSIELGSLNLVFHAYNNLYRVSEAMGNYKGAYENYRQYVTIRDSMYSTDIAKSKNELEIKYQVEAQQKQLELMEEKGRVKELQVQQKNYVIIALVSGIIAVILIVTIVIIVLVTFAKNKEAKFARKKAELEQQALRSQMNPHFIFNSLNSIQRLYVEGKTNQASEYMADFSTLMRKILDNSTKNKISLKEEIGTLKLYLEMEKLRCGELMEYQLSLDPEIDLLYTYIPPMIIQPFVENAIWHGILPKKEKGTVKIELTKTSSGLICSIEDNGVGFMAKKNSHESKGIQLTEQRLNAKVKIEPLSPGTKITFTIPS
jgi:tetratricopeptide (TPR) repeat protein